MLRGAALRGCAPFDEEGHCWSTKIDLAGKKPRRYSTDGFAIQFSLEGKLHLGGFGLVAVELG